MPRFAQKRKRSSYGPYKRSNRRKRNPPPLIPSYVTRRRRGTGYRGSNRVMRNIALQLSESKEVHMSLPFTGGTGTASWNGFHDTLYGCNLHDAVNDQGITAQLTMGNGAATTRAGREVFSQGFRIRGNFTIPFDRRNTRIKMWLVEWNTVQGSPITHANLFENTVGSTMLDPINNERYPGIRKLRDMRLTARDLYIERGEVTDDGSKATLHYNMWIPFKRKLGWPEYVNLKAPKSGLKEYLTLIMTPYDEPDTLTTDRLVTAHEQCVTWYFRDP